MQIHYRDEEAIYVRASEDRVTVIFSTIFREETDRAFGKVFFQVLAGHNLSSTTLIANLVLIRNFTMLDEE